MSTIQVTHAFVRALAKNLRTRYGREIKHTDIIADIAAAAGQPADALMHKLKHAGEKAGHEAEIGFDLDFDKAAQIEPGHKPKHFDDGHLRKAGDTRDVRAVMRRAFEEAATTSNMLPRPEANVAVQATALAKLAFAAARWANGPTETSDPGSKVD